MFNMCKGVTTSTDKDEYNAKMKRLDDIPKINVKIDQLEASINESLRKLKNWLGVLGRYLHSEMTQRRWPNVPDGIQSAPKLEIQ